MSFKIGQPVMVKKHVCHTFEPKYLLDYKVLNTINERAILLTTPNGKERKININNLKPCSTIELKDNAWYSFLGSLKTKGQNLYYNL